MTILHESKMSVDEAKTTLLTLLGPDAVVSMSGRRGKLSCMYEVIEEMKPDNAIAFVRQWSDDSGQPVDKIAMIRFYKGENPNDKKYLELRYCIEQVAHVEDASKTHFHRRDVPIKDAPFLKYRVR
jgi:hypothetical protein